MPNRLVDMLNRIGTIFLNLSVTKSGGSSALLVSTKGLLALNCAPRLQKRAPMSIKISRKNYCTWNRSVSHARTEVATMAWIPILTAVTNSLPAQSNRMVWWSGSRTRWFDTLCFAPVGSWNYGLWLSLTYDPLIFLNGWLWYPIKKLYLSMQVFVRLWFLFLTQYLFSKCMVPTAMWLRRGLKSYRMFCAATPPRQQGKKTKLERHGFVLHTVKVRFFGPIPINKLQVKPWFDHENISVSCSSIEWICFTSIKYCSGIHFVENLL